MGSFEEVNALQMTAGVQIEHLYGVVLFGWDKEMISLQGVGKVMKSPVTSGM